MENAKFLGNFILRGRFECKTGLHIGGSKEKLEIGGVDSPVVRDPRTRYPYVPGSSLKGKLRSLLEFGLGVVPPDGEPSTDRDVARLFGIGVAEKDPKSDNYVKDLDKIGPSRLLVRDCHPDAKTVEWWEKLDTELLYTEYKSENGINRITSAANPRFIERVAAGSQFEFEMIYTAYDMGDGEDTEQTANADLQNLRMALLMLEHNFLGKSGSRGYGRVQFHFADTVWMGQKDYLVDKDKKMTAATGDIAAKLKSIDDITWSISLHKPVTP